MGLSKRLMTSLVVAALAGCGSAESPEELAEEVFSLLQDGDFAAYFEDAVAKPQQVLGVCPAKASYSVDQAQHQTRFEACLRRFNFPSAEISNVAAKYNTAVSCEPNVGSVEEITVTVVNDLEILTFKIKGALKTEDGWLATGPLDCPGK